MAMHIDVMRTVSDDMLYSTMSNDDQQSGAFHFTIDGQEFIAVNREKWCDEHDAAIVNGSTSTNILGEIVTSLGDYVVLADDTPLATEPKVADLLSRRELQVALLIADGSCDKDIARQLAISVYTVREHIRRIFAKLHVCRRAGVIARILRRQT